MCDFQLCKEERKIKTCPYCDFQYCPTHWPHECNEYRDDE